MNKEIEGAIVDKEVWSTQSCSVLSQSAVTNKCLTLAVQKAFISKGMLLIYMDSSSQLEKRVPKILQPLIAHTSMGCRRSESRNKETVDLSRIQNKRWYDRRMHDRWRRSQKRRQ